jgi:hypothetical protein
MTGFRALTVGLALTLQACSSSQPGMPNVLVYQNDGTFRKTSGVPGVFSAQRDGSVLHMQSGFVCPAAYPNARFYALHSYPSSAAIGTDVGCDYAGRDPASGRIAAKFTIFLVKAREGATLDREFERYLSEMHGAQPEQVGGNGLRLTGEVASKGSPARLQEEEITQNGRAYRDELIVGIVNGWVIEVRSTYPAGFSLDDPAAAKGPPASAIMWAKTVGAFVDGRKDRASNRFSPVDFTLRPRA